LQSPDDRNLGYFLTAYWSWSTTAKIILKLSVCVLLQTVILNHSTIWLLTPTLSKKTTITCLYYVSISVCCKQRPLYQNHIFKITITFYPRESFREGLWNHWRTFVCLSVCLFVTTITKSRSSAIAEGPRDASCRLKSCQLPRNNAETTYTTSPDQIDGIKLEI